VLEELFVVKGEWERVEAKILTHPDQNHQETGATSSAPHMVSDL